MSDDNKKKLGEQLIRCVLDDKLPVDKKLKKMDYIIRLGADVNARHENGFSVLVSAKTIRNDEVVSFLEERGANCIGCDKEKAEEFFRTASVEEINKVLKVLPDGYKLNCNVDLSERGLTELPDFSKLIVAGNFYCSINQLDSLEGAPREVAGDFYCCSSQLTTLRGAPSVVGGGFDCSSNLLDSLEGAPSKVSGTFDCSFNQLVSLRGAPREVGRSFICSGNQLTSLEGAPTKVGKSFDCGSNKLVTLEGAPSKVGKSFDCGYNYLTSLEGAPSEVGDNFCCVCNHLKSYKGKPDKIGGKFVAPDIEQVNNINAGNGR